jgi:hypothetical protein
VPQADSRTAANDVHGCNDLFDHLVGAAGKWQRNGDAERFGGLDVKLDFGCLLDR